jgi:short-subunit dehydrogenase
MKSPATGPGADVDVRGTRVLITGASRGIGYGLAREFAAQGARVALVARSADVIEKLAADLSGDAYPVDLADADALAGLIARVERDGELDVLVNNAGIDETGRFSDMAPATIEAVMRVNLVAPVELCRQAVAAMVPRRRGHIVNVSSLAAMVTFPGLAVYGASKAGLSRFTAGLRAELGGTGVGTTLVELGGVKTEMVDNTRAYDPARRAWERVERLRLSIDMEVDKVAARIVQAVLHDRATVQLPRRASAFPLLSQAPWHLTDLLLLGVDRHSTEPKDAQ